MSPERQEVPLSPGGRGPGVRGRRYVVHRNASAWQRRAKRPQWEDLQAAIRRGDVSVLMAYSLTRLGRRNRDLADLSEFLKRHGCDLVVVDQSYDTTTPGGRLVFYVHVRPGRVRIRPDQRTGQVLHRTPGAARPHAYRRPAPVRLRTRFDDQGRRGEGDPAGGRRPHRRQIPPAMCLRSQR